MGFIDSLIDAGASAITAIPQAIFGHYENNRNMHFQSDEAKAQRDWQSSENQKNRQWQEDMYNLYNSPSAMMRQYKEANLNPFLMASQNNIGNGMSATPSSGSGASAAGSSPPALSPHSGLYLQSLGVNANAANQRANATKTKWETAAMIFDKIGPQAYYHYIKSNPDMVLGDPESALAARETKTRIAQSEQQTANMNFELQLKQSFSEQQISQGLEQGQYAIAESVARLNTMRISNDVALKRLANDTLVSLAQAFKLEKEGEYYVANSATINALRQYVVATTKAQSILLGNDVYYSNLYRQNFADAADYLMSADAKSKTRSGVEFDLTERGDQIHRFTQMVLQDMGNVIHVGYGDVRSNSVSHGFNVNQSSSKSESVNFNYNY